MGRIRTPQTAGDAIHCAIELTVTLVVLIVAAFVFATGGIRESRAQPVADSAIQSSMQGRIDPARALRRPAALQGRRTAAQQAPTPLSATF